jgi:hypothetical protein
VKAERRKGKATARMAEDWIRNGNLFFASSRFLFFAPLRETSSIQILKLSQHWSFDRD